MEWGYVVEVAHQAILVLGVIPGDEKLLGEIERPAEERHVFELVLHETFSTLQMQEKEHTKI